MANSKKKILIIRLGAIGDVVHTTIIAKAIKEKHPDYEIHYITQSGIAPILSNNPYIDKVYLWSRKDRKSLSYTLSVCRELYKERYDIIFSLTNSIRNLILSVLSFPKRIVIRKYLKKSWVEEFFYTAKSVIDDIELPDRLYLAVDEESDSKIEEFIKDYPRPYIMLVAGGGTKGNRQGRVWNPEKWTQLISLLKPRYGGTIFVCGSKGERETHNQFTKSGAIVTSGDFSLSQSSALLSKADMVISGDTGPAHIASAHGVPVISLLGSTSPDKIKPYGKNGYYVSAKDGCKYCWKKRCKYLKQGEHYTPCMEGITPEMVMSKIEELHII